MNDNNVIIALISTIGAIIVTFMTVKYKDKVIKKEKNRPLDRMEGIFDGYEKLIKQQQVDIDRKSVSVGHMGNIIDRLEKELSDTRKLLDIARAELDQSREQNKYLTLQLEAMKQEYAHPERVAKHSKNEK